MAENPNDASAKSKAEGDRWSSDGEEIVNQSSPSGDRSKCGPPDGQTGRRDKAIDMDDAMIDTDREGDERRSER
jgi:hypothetical protein